MCTTQGDGCCGKCHQDAGQDRAGLNPMLQGNPEKIAALVLSYLPCAADTSNEPTLTIEVAPAEMSALQEALALYTAVGAGQVEALYWNMLRPGRLRQVSGERLSERQLSVIHQHLDGIKAVLGLPVDECYGLDHPDVDYSVKQAARLEERLSGKKG